MTRTTTIEKVQPTAKRVRALKKHKTRDAQSTEVSKMAARLKDKGLEELASVKRRVKRQGAMQRIARESESWLVEHLEEIERYIARMNELPDKERELF